MNLVIFFGGYLATQIEVSLWQESVKKQKPDTDVLAYPYPIGASAAHPLIPLGVLMVQAALRHIQTSKPDVISIVGHSSGCALANELAVRALAAGVTDFQLVALDGFRPDIDLIKRPTTECWSAEYGHVRSLNYAALCTTPNFHVYTPKQPCQSWALHFSLVNANASDKLIGEIPQGYRDCEANLCWWPSETTKPIV